ncbi:MAG: hypothetical protein ACXW3Q_09735 [Rhodoplanes sp.]
MDGGVERLLKDRGKGARAGKKPISAGMPPFNLICRPLGIL